MNIETIDARELATRLYSAAGSVRDAAVSHPDEPEIRVMLDHGDWLPLQHLRSTQYQDLPAPLLIALASLATLADFADRCIGEGETSKLIKGSAAR